MTRAQLVHVVLKNAGQGNRNMKMLGKETSGKETSKSPLNRVTGKKHHPHGDLLVLIISRVISGVTSAESLFFHS